MDSYWPIPESSCTAFFNKPDSNLTQTLTVTPEHLENAGVQVASGKEGEAWLAKNHHRLKTPRDVAVLKIIRFLQPIQLLPFFHGIYSLFLHLQEMTSLCDRHYRTTHSSSKTEGQRLPWQAGSASLWGSRRRALRQRSIPMATHCLPIQKPSFGETRHGPGTSTGRR